MNRARVALLIPVLLMSAVLSSAQAHAQRFPQVASIPVNSSPLGVAVNPLTNRTYVALYSSSVAVIFGDNTSITMFLPTGARVVAVNEATNRIYVAGCDFTTFPAPCGVSVIDGSNNTIVAAIPTGFAEFGGLQGIAVNPVTNQIYVSDLDASAIDVIDGNTNTITSSISLGGQQPIGVAVDPITNRVYVAISAPLVAVIDGKTQQVLTRIQVGASNNFVAVNPFKQRAYVTSDSSTLGVIDTKSLKVVANIPVNTTSLDVAVDLLSNTVFVTDQFLPELAVVNGSSYKVITTLPHYGSFVDVNPVTKRVYVSNQISGTVDVLAEQ